MGKNNNNWNATIRQDCSIGTLYIFGQFDPPKILLFKITE